MSRSRIDVITNSDGAVLENDLVPATFVSHYEMFIGMAGAPINFNSINFFNSFLDAKEANYMIREVSEQEIKDALFSIGDDKSPGPDGFTAVFFKEAWTIIVDDVINAIGEFFRNGNILKELNHTIIALLPKIKSPTRVTDYRPISCCNVLFKCISKIIANRIKHSLKKIVSYNRSAFILGRSITDNILLTQKLMHNYHLDRGTPRCAFKVDIQKAYDTVDWDFLQALDEFKEASGLVTSIPKSTAYFCNVLNHVKLSILQILPFVEGTLPVKYFGVPLVSSRLMIRDFNELIDRVQIRIQD
nr:hypothetical protein [Tanacetum cinerariifolium]